jgi:hypothetical protein
MTGLIEWPIAIGSTNYSSANHMPAIDRHLNFAANHHYIGLEPGAFPGD